MNTNGRVKRRFWNGLRGKITGQLLIAALVPAIAVAVVALLTTQNSFNEIATELSAAHDTTEVAAGNALSARAVLVARRLDETLLGNLKNMTQWVALPSVVRAAQQGAATADELTLTLDDIETLERIRANDRELGNDPAVPALLSTLVCVLGLRRIFFTEAHGYTVAGSNPTSDFVQSDEEWWQVAWDTGFYAGQPEFDDSANAYIIPFAMRIDDRVSGQHLGVMKLGLDISNLQALAEAEAATLDQGSILIFDRQTGERVADTLTSDDLTSSTPRRVACRRGSMPPMIVAATLQPDEPTYATPATADGEALVTGYARSGGEDVYGAYGGFQGFDWAVSVSQPERVVMASMDALTDTQNRLQDQASHIVGIFALIGFFTLLGGAIMAAWQTRLIVNPIARLQGTALQLSEGDLAARADVSADDEVGDLAQAFNRMADDLQAMVEAERASKAYLEKTISEYMVFVEAVSNGNLVTRLQLNGHGAHHDETEDDLLQLGLNLNKMVENLYEMARQVGETAVSVSSAATEIQAAATQLVASANEQDSAVTQTVATVEEVRATVKQTADRAQLVANASQQSVAISGDGQNSVANTVEGMKLIRQRVESIAETILMLSERTQQIGEIIGTVNALADQSKLLALNASIEAARAGEEGKGFAVVAMEVRQLAEQSREATSRVREILSEISAGHQHRRDGHRGRQQGRGKRDGTGGAGRRSHPRPGRHHRGVGPVGHADRGQYPPADQRHGSTGRGHAPNPADDHPDGREHAPDRAERPRSDGHGPPDGAGRGPLRVVVRRDACPAGMARWGDDRDHDTGDLPKGRPCFFGLADLLGAIY